MKKNTVKINESILRQIVAESVKKVLKEGSSNTEEISPEDERLNAYFANDRKLMSLIDESGDALQLMRVIWKAASKISSLADMYNRFTVTDKWFAETKPWADRVKQEAWMFMDGG